MIKALVTGFAPFAGDAINPSYEAVRRLPARIGELQIVTAELPTSFARAPRVLRQWIAREQPGIVLCVGLAADRPAISLERVAVNLSDARIADNDGAQPHNKPVIARGPAAYFSTLPVVQAQTALTRAGIAAELSLSAGAFVCNHVFYGLMHAASKQRRIKHAGFVHVPALPANDDQHALGQLTRALAIVLRVSSHNRRSKR